MDETRGMVHPEANGSQIVNLWIQTSYVFPKYSSLTSMDRDSHSKR